MAPLPSIDDGLALLAERKAVQWMLSSFPTERAGLPFPECKFAPIRDLNRI